MAFDDEAERGLRTAFEAWIEVLRRDAAEQVRRGGSRYEIREVAVDRDWNTWHGIPGALNVAALRYLLARYDIERAGKGSA